MPIVVVLPVPLTPTMSVTCGEWPLTTPGPGRCVVDRVEDAPDLALDQLAQAFAAARAVADRGDDLLGGGDADVGRNQQLLERLDRIDVDLSGVRPARVGALDDLVEPVDNLLLRAGQPVTKPIKKSQVPTPVPSSS